MFSLALVKTAVHHSIEYPQVLVDLGHISPTIPDLALFQECDGYYVPGVDIYLQKTIILL